MLINGRFLTQNLTGSQRYAYEVSRRLANENRGEVGVAIPRSDAVIPPDIAGVTETVGNLKGHLWEQVELGSWSNRRGGVLWSPVNVGPVNARNHVVTIHDVFSIQTPQWVGRRFHRWYSLLLPRLASSARHIITVSEYSKSTILESLGVPADKVSVVELGVDPKFCIASDDEISRIRREYGLPESFILTLGSLEPRKNLEAVVEGWRQIEESQRLPLYIAGGQGVSRVFGKYDTSGLETGEGVHLLGYIPERDLAPLYSAASVFVYASLLEGFGLPPLEALACGTPVVMSDNSAMSETHLGLGYMVDPTTPQSIAEGILSAMCADGSDAERNVERKNRSDRIRTRYDWDITATRIGEILGSHE